MAADLGSMPEKDFLISRIPIQNPPLASTKYFMQHNVFLAYLTETGLVGLLDLMAVLIADDPGQSGRVAQSRNGFMAPVSFGLLMIVVLLNFVINGMFHDVSISPMVNSLLVLHICDRQQRLLGTAGLPARTPQFDTCGKFAGHHPPAPTCSTKRSNRPPRPFTLALPVLKLN